MGKGRFLIRKYIIMVMVFAILLPALAGQISFAQNDWQFTIRVRKDVDLPGWSPEGHKFDLWKIGETSPAISNDELRSKLGELKKYSPNALDDIYGGIRLKTEGTSREGEVVASVPSTGYYYVRPQSSNIINPFIALVLDDYTGVAGYDNTDSSGNVVYRPKVTVPTETEPTETEPTEPPDTPPTYPHRFIKVDANDQAAGLAGAEFVVMEIDDQGRYSTVQKDANDYIIKSSADGSFNVEGLPPGTYYLQERRAPGGYILSEDYIEFTVGPNAGTTALPTIITNERRETPPREVELVKRADTKEILPGAEFKLYRIEGNEKVPVPTTGYTYDPNGTEQIFITNAEGKINITGLPPGDYIFEEVKPPNGYVIRNKDNNFTMPETGPGVFLTVYNDTSKDRGGHKFLKVDSQDKSNHLSGAKFMVMTRDPEGRYQAVKVNGEDYIVTSGPDGSFEVANLPYGIYYLKEIEAPGGYILAENYVEFIVDGGTTGLQTVIPNERRQSPPPEIPGEPPTTPPDRPRRPRLPETGDIILPILALAGVSLIVMGNVVIKRSESDGE